MTGGQRRIRQVLAAAAAGLVMAVAPAAADQRDPRLDGLFRELKTTTDRTRGLELTRRIWAIWFLNPDATVNRMMAKGGALIRERRLAEAVVQFSAVVRRAPNFAEGWNRRAVARFLAGDLDGSLQDILRTLALEPRHFGALSGMAMIYERRGQLRNALAAARRAFAANPHQPGLRRNIRRMEKQLRERDI